MNEISARGWFRGLVGASLGLAAGITGAVVGLSATGEKPAQAQAFSGPSIEIAATTVGAASHAYAIDSRMQQVIFCRAGVNDAKPACVGVPVPGSAQR